MGSIYLSPIFANDHRTAPVSSLEVGMEINLKNPDFYINRELSWLDFNRRVLEEAQDGSNPLLERVKFLAIVANNLDEFFEVRVAGLLQMREAGTRPTGPDRLPPEQQLEKIAAKAHHMVEVQYRCWKDDLLPALATEGIYLREARKLEGDHLAFIRRYWTEELEPILTPIVVDPAHPFPRVINKALCIGALLESNGQTALGVATVPRVLPRILRLPNKGEDIHFVTLGDIMEFLVNELFSGHRVLGSAAFRITRNSELYVNEEEADNLLEEIVQKLNDRRKGDAVRLEIAANAPNQLVKQLQNQFELNDDQVYRADGPVNLNRVMSIYGDVPRPDLKFSTFAPVKQNLPRKPEAFFETVRRRDILLHHPYESFDTVIDFINMAAEDPNVLAIKQTLYRTGEDSQVSQALIDAANNGKEVTVLVELKARFDEASNVERAKIFEESGVHVVYGVMGLKTHCKLSMLVRRDRDRLRRYVHLGTGNYNHITARFYTDLGMITARSDITADVAKVFNLLTARAPQTSLQKLLVAPSNLLQGTLERIGRESEHARAGRVGAIIAKMNGLVDPQVIQALYRASQAGVQIDLVVRGICCLRPGLPGVSENIRVYSVIGRFLEHSRVFYFANGGDREVWAGSADWMNRNLRGRVEVVFPIESENLKQRIYGELLKLCLSDRVKSRMLQPDGSYTRLQPSSDEAAGMSAQDALMLIALGQDPQVPANPPDSGNGQARARPKVSSAKSP